MILTYFQAISMYIRRSPNIIGFVIVSLIISIFPYINTILLNTIIERIQNQAYQILFVLIFGYVLFAIIRDLMNNLNQQFIFRASREMSNALQLQIHSKVMKVSSLSFEAEQWYKQYRRVEHITGCVHDLFISTVALLSAVITLITYIIYLFELIPFYFALLGALIIIPALIKSFVFSRQSYFSDRAVDSKRQRAGDIQGMFLDINILKEIKLFFSDRHIINRLRDKTDEVQKQKRNIEFKYSFYCTLMYLLVGAIVFVILSLVYTSNSSAQNTTATMITLIPFMLTLVSSFDQTSNHMDGVFYSTQEYQEIRDFLMDKTHEVQTSDAKLPCDFSIQLDNVTFSYPNSIEPVLHDITLTIKPYETVALVGQNGCGKTTLLKVLAGLYPPESGEIYYDRINVQNIDRHEIYDKISFAFQSPVKYPFCLKDNVSLFEDKPERCKIAQEMFDDTLYHDDKILSPGYTNSRNVSGGQWQKIGLARALGNNSSVYIFDEPTSALDPIAEIEIFNSFFAHTKGKCVILSTHRLGLARKADRIIVMDRGRVIGQGTHDELIQSCIEYRELYDSQKQWYTMRNEDAKDEK